VFLKGLLRRLQNFILREWHGFYSVSLGYEERIAILQPDRVSRHGQEARSDDRQRPVQSLGAAPAVDGTGIPTADRIDGRCRQEPAGNTIRQGDRIQPLKVIVFNQDSEAEWGLSFLDFLKNPENTVNIPVILLSQKGARFSSRIEEADNDTECFQKSIAIEPFVEYFRQITGESPSPVT
jgi:hypothetical protein